jgi:hypothetical protein
VLFHDVAVLIDIFSVNVNTKITSGIWRGLATLPICGIRAASALGITTPTTESPVATFDSGGSGEEIFTAKLADTGNHGRLMRHGRYDLLCTAPKVTQSPAGLC